MMTCDDVDQFLPPLHVANNNMSNHKRKKNDSGMLADSGLTKLNKLYFDQENQPDCVYCDPAYPLRVLLEGSLKHPAARPTPEQINYSKAMDQVPASVEWVLWGYPKLFCFFRFQEKIKNWT